MKYFLTSQNTIEIVATNCITTKSNTTIGGGGFRDKILSLGLTYTEAKTLLIPRITMKDDKVVKKVKRITKTIQPIDFAALKLKYSTYFSVKNIETEAEFFSELNLFELQTSDFTI